MSKSTPSDLAVAFRSLPRRLSQARNDDTPAAAVAAATSAVEGALAEAAGVVGSAAEAAAIAAAIDARDIRDWTDSDLGALQAAADRGATAVRTLANLAERA